MKKLVDGVLVDLTAEEIAVKQAEETSWDNGAFDRAMVDLRVKRDNLLKETDWYALSDVTMSAEMTTYRQNLRDITNGVDTVEKANNVTWPTKP